MKRWPRWASQLAQRISVRTMPWELSVWVLMAPALTPSQKLGQPVPDSNLVALLNSSASQQMQWYIPLALWFQ